MLHSSYRLPGFELTLWESPSASGRASRDASLIRKLPGGFRVAVIDGTTPIGSERERSASGADYAVWAATLLRSALLVGSKLDEAAYRANAALLADPQAGTAAFAACELRGSSLNMLRAGNCTVWTRSSSGGGFEPLLVEHDRWRSKVLGRFELPLLEGARGGSSLAECVLASDGARLTPARLDRGLDEWLAELRDWENDQPDGLDERHDDVTVWRLLRTGAGARDD
jgi:hypothetical protein